MRRLVFAFFVALAFGFVAVNAQTIGPTSDSNQQLGVNNGTATDGSEAFVAQTVNVIIPAATALHSTAGTLEFNLNDIGSQDSTWTCVSATTPPSGAGTLDTTTGDWTLDLTSYGSEFYGQTQVLPMGTYYDPATWPDITVHGGGVIDQYPPATLGSDGKVSDASKQYFVCYRTFELQTFSNFSKYDLQVTRAPTGDSAQDYPEPIYIQGNTYCSFTATPPAATGFYALDYGSTSPAHLIPQSIGTGPTGQVAEACSQPGNTSWLNNLIVVAVKIDGEHYGTSSTTLTYTLFSADGTLP